jgi:tetratricopeptide (TPR) repeat protein
MSSTNTISKGSFVKLLGLQSEAGKKLNGAHGIVLGAAKLAGGVHRYPVRMYAAPIGPDSEHYQDGEERMTVMKQTSDKLFKEANLVVTNELRDQPFFSHAARFHMQETHETGDQKANLFWAEHLYNLHPEEGVVSCAYATCLEAVGNAKQASEVLWKHRHEIISTKDVHDPKFNPAFLHRAAMIFSRAQEHLEEALEYALLIPTDNELDVLRYENALMEILPPTQKLLRSDPLRTNTDPSIIDVQFRLCRALHDRAPDDVERLVLLGDVYDSKDENVRSAQCFRRAHDLVQLDPSQNNGRPYTDPDLIRVQMVVSQMHCPGMPFAEYLMMPRMRNYTHKIVCDAIRRDHRHRVFVDGDGMVRGWKEDYGRVDILQDYELPKDPDDESVFPTSFLEQLRWTAEPTRI